MGEVQERAGEAGASVDPLWDDWETPPRVPSAPELHVDGFDGPLDMLLDLVERQRLDLGRLSILAVVEQFVAAMTRYAERVSLERRADWLVMASRLVLLRSRLCFPPSPEAKAEAERDAQSELDRVEKLRVVRANAAWLEARPQLGRDMFTRPHEQSPRVSSYMDLMEACLAIILREEEQALPIPASATLTVRLTRLFPMEEVLASMRARLLTLSSPQPLDVFVPAVPEKADDLALARRAALSSTLIAALELGRCGEVSLRQRHERDVLLVGSLR